jgi:hypothetical protein
MKQKSSKFYYGRLSVLQTLLHITILPFLAMRSHQIPVFLQQERFHKHIGAKCIAALVSWWKFASCVIL